MAKTLIEYAEWLDQRGLLWPQVPEIRPPKAKPYLKPLAGIKAVSWSIYGTLLRISDGELLFDHEEELRREIACEKTLEEFNMWNSMTRKPGSPWLQLHQQYAQLLEQARMESTRRKGEIREVDVRTLWRKIVDRLRQKNYSYQENIYGDLDQLSEKIAWYYQHALQGVEAAPQSVRTVKILADQGIPQGLLGHGQFFTLVQLQRAFQKEETVPPLGTLFSPTRVTLSWELGVRSPSPSLFQRAVERWEQQGIAPHEVLHVGARLEQDLLPARKVGMKTALYAGDELSLKATSAQVKDPQMKPDRLLTELSQIRDLIPDS